MKRTMKVLEGPKNALAVRAGQAVLDQLPIDGKKLRRAAALMEPKNLKRLGVIAASGVAALSLGGTLAQARLTRAALAKELKKQLAPVNKKLDELEKQNAELQRQNAELQRRLTERE